jgi:plastocyanin
LCQPKGVDEMIMSPMQEKKGDKFSYTFTVPGTYKFHCHAHEQLGME